MARAVGVQVKRWIKRILFLVYVIFLLEGMSQIAIRVLTGKWPLGDQGSQNAALFEPHPYLVGVPRAGARVSRDGLVVSIDSLGYRRSDVSTTPTDRTLRVLALGGSTTFGVGVDDRDTWPNMLQQDLNAMLPDQLDAYDDAEVVNGGVPGYTSAENIIQLALRGVHLRPHVVILFQGLNDMRNAHSPGLRPDYTNFHAISQRGNLALDRPRWGNRSGLMRLVRVAVDRALFSSTPGVPSGPRGQSPDLAAEQIFRANLQTFAGICRVHLLSCIYVPQVVTDAYPMDEWWLLYLDPQALNSTMQRYNEILRGVAAEEGMRFAAEILDTVWGPEDFRDYIHFSPLGDRKFARLLAPGVLTAVRDGLPRPAN